MKINWALVNVDMLENIAINSCPTMFRNEAQNIVSLVASTEPFNYSKISQFDKHLIINYWRRFDGLDRALAEPSTFRQWFLATATNPELIRRARQWLVEKNYLIPQKRIEQQAQEAGNKWRAGVKG